MSNQGPYKNHPDEPVESVTAAKVAAQEMIDTFLHVARKHHYAGFDISLMNSMRLISASSDPLNGHKQPWVLWEVDLGPQYGNLNGVMHGGAAALILDMCTATALCPVQKPMYWDFMTGVSRSMNISYLKAAPVGITVRVFAQAIQHGRTTALIRGSLESVDGKVVYATVDHHKINVPSLEEHISLRDEMRKAKKEKQMEDSRGKSKL